jgi:pimeloyl-ACP methyl ester carboxylesterase
LIDDPLVGPPDGAAPALHLRRWGAGPTRTLLVHGFAENGEIWENFARRLGHPAVAVDLRGHGDSGWDELRRYDALSHLKDLCAIVDAHEGGPLNLIGHSLGGLLSVLLAACRPQLVDRVVVVDYGPDPDSTALARIHADLRDSLRIYDTPQDFAALLRRKRPFLSSLNAVTLAESLLRRQPDGRFRLKCDPALAEPRRHPANPLDLWEVLAELRCPALVVRGIASSALTPATARRMVEIMPDAELRLVDNAGHGVVTDNPDGFAAATLPFLTVECEDERSEDSACFACKL